MGRCRSLGILLPVSGLAVALVLLSALAHATWNLLVKRGANQEVFLWWAQLSIAALLLPVGVLLLATHPVEYPGWWWILGRSALHVAYFLFLGRAYRSADFSLIYPIARGVGPAVVPILGVVILNEIVSPLAIGGIVVIVGGVYTVYGWGNLKRLTRDPLGILKEPGIRYAVLTGLVIAAYSVYDKVGVRYVSPFLYMYLISVGAAVGLAPYVLRVHGVGHVRAEWKENGASILAVGLLTFLAYGLVLTALQLSRVSYVTPTREVGVVLGVLLGTLILKERFSRGRLLGSVVIATGVLLVALAP